MKIAHSVVFGDDRQTAVVHYTDKGKLSKERVPIAHAIKVVRADAVPMKLRHGKPPLRALRFCPIDTDPAFRRDSFLNSAVKA